MGKRVYIALVVVAVALVGVIVWQVWQQREPVYQGKPLSFWLRGYRTGHEPGANAAVLQAGTNAIPTLLRLLRARDSALKVRLMDLARRQHIIEIQNTTALDWNSAARDAFALLGTNAQSAVPALIGIANQDLSSTSQCWAILALGSIGPPAKDAVPSLLAWATNADPILRLSATIALGKIHAEVDRVAPVLIGALHDPDSRVRDSAVSALENFGPNAKPAVPALIELLNVPSVNRPYDYQSKLLIADALKAIDPEAAAKAAVK